MWQVLILQIWVRWRSHRLICSSAKQEVSEIKICEKELFTSVVTDEDTSDKMELVSSAFCCSITLMHWKGLTKVT